MDPTLQSKIRHMVESEGLTPEEVLRRLHEDAERQLAEQADEEERRRRGVRDLAATDTIPGEIQLIAQALAYRSATLEDLEEVHSILNQAYGEEVQGEEAFRSGDPVSRESVLFHLSEPSYQWIVLEAPSGHGLERDGALLGVCCFSTDGVSKKNGVVEGNVGSIRFLGVLSRYRGLCLGRRLLSKVEERVFKLQCVRIAIAVPSPREKMLDWVSERGYEAVRDIPYPFEGLRHSPLPEKINPQEVYLVQFTKTNPNPLDNNVKSPATAVPPPQPAKKMSLPPHWRQSSPMPIPTEEERVSSTARKLQKLAIQEQVVDAETNCN